MYYLPDINYRCFVVQDYNTIRAYEEVPRQNSTISYTDFYVNSHYMNKSGTQTFSQYTNLPTCLGNGMVTNNVFYRNDFSDIMIIFFLLLIICFYFPYKILARGFGRWFKI